MNRTLRTALVVANSLLQVTYSISRLQALHRRPISSWICEECCKLKFSTGYRYKSQIESRTRSWSSEKKGNFKYQLRAYNTGKGDGGIGAKDDLPSHLEGQRSPLSKRFAHFMDHMQSNVFIAGQRLNDLTGYSGIEILKKDIEDQERIVQSNRVILQGARKAYSSAIEKRSSSQREVNTLLQHKHAWEPSDLERFTALYRSDHANEQAEASARERLTEVEKASEEAAARLSASILARYHEEQIWSDKIRRMSTWGTWGLMGVNVLLFFIFQIGVEPWRRKRLVKGFEEKVAEALDREAISSKIAPDAALEETVADERETATSQPLVVERHQASINDPPSLLLSAIEEPLASSADSRSLLRLGMIWELLRDMFSDRQITVRKVDLTTATLEGAATGIAFAGMIIFLLRPR